MASAQGKGFQNRRFFRSKKNTRPVECGPTCSDLKLDVPRKRTIRLLFAAAIAAVALPCQAARLSDLRVYIAGGQRYMSIKDLASFYGLSMRVPPGRFIYIQNKWTTIQFEVDSRHAVVNGAGVWLHLPVLKLRGKWMVTEADAHKIVDPIMRPEAYLGGRDYRVVVLDPGHGGPDRGARGRHGLEEKGAVLDIAKRVRAELANAGLKVYLTRETDRFIELEERPLKTARWGGDVFVSIHLNSAVSSAPKGVETYAMTAAGYPSTASPAAAVSRSDRTSYPGNRFDNSSTVLGYYIHRAMVQKLKTEDRGLRRARFMVLKQATCPSVLVECGFVSNSGEESRLMTNDHRQTVALAIARGVLEYIGAVKRARAGS